jgi:hypothetical protein
LCIFANSSQLAYCAKTKTKARAQLREAGLSETLVANQGFEPRRSADYDSAFCAN